MMGGNGVVVRKGGDETGSGSWGSMELKQLMVQLLLGMLVPL